MCSDLNGGCSDLCVPVPDSVKCLCPSGKALQQDGKLCVSSKNDVY